jgi:hypothetical protein
MVEFPSLGLIVKFGRSVSIAEGQTLWALRHYLGDALPVPEIFGWRCDGGRVFLYMERVEGATLEREWTSMSTAERDSVCAQLRQTITALRRLRQPAKSTFVGTWSSHLSYSLIAKQAHSPLHSAAQTRSLKKAIKIVLFSFFLLIFMPLIPASPGRIARQPIVDCIFEGRRNFGPFTSVAAFHDAFSSLPSTFRADDPHPLRHWLCDDQPIVFTHGDLHRSNVIVQRLDSHSALAPEVGEDNGAADTAPPAVRVIAIVDWEQSGWFPGSWEYCKACWTAKIGDEWRTKYIPAILDPFDGYDQ